MVVGALSGADALLTACGGSASSAVNKRDDTGALMGPGGIPLARRDHPVTLPLYCDNEPISSGLDLENGPLNLFNWAAYINPAVVRKFEKEHNVQVTITTFENEEEAISKLTVGQDAVRRLVGNRRLHLARGRREADPAAQPLVSRRT